MNAVWLMAGVFLKGCSVTARYTIFASYDRTSQAVKTVRVPSVRRASKGSTSCPLSGLALTTAPSIVVRCRHVAARTISLAAGLAEENNNLLPNRKRVPEMLKAIAAARRFLGARGAPLFHVVIVQHKGPALGMSRIENISSGPDNVSEFGLVHLVDLRWNEVQSLNSGMVRGRVRGRQCKGLDTLLNLRRVWTLN